MISKFKSYLAGAALMLALLACSIGEQANPLTPQQELLAKIPQHYSGVPQVEKTFIGEVSGSQTYVALVIQNDVVVGYVCDGDAISEWLSGEVKAGQIDLTTSQGTHLIAAQTADSVTGTLTFSGGQPLAFSAQPAVEGSTGLFRTVGVVSDVTYTTGWIIGPAGARGETNSTNGTENAVIVDVDPTASIATALRIRSDSNEYTIAHHGVGYNLHAFSVLQLAVNPGQNDFDYFCNNNKFFAGGIQVPEGNILTVDLVGEGCQAVPSAPQPVIPVTDSGGSGAAGSGSAGSDTSGSTSGGASPTNPVAIGNGIGFGNFGGLGNFGGGNFNFGGSAQGNFQAGNFNTSGGAQGNFQGGNFNFGGGTGLNASGGNFGNP